MRRKTALAKFLLIFKRTYSVDRNYSTAMGTFSNAYEAEVFPENIQVDNGVLPKPYSQIPGPKELPFIGNAWRFAPIIGKYI